MNNIDPNLTRTQENLVSSAVPEKHFALPPYRAELLNTASGWSGVMNANGVNVLTFPQRPGCVVTDIETAQKIAEVWNTEIKST